jgi:hypothetical protein
MSCQQLGHVAKSHIAMWQRVIAPSLNIGVWKTYYDKMP